MSIQDDSAGRFDGCQDVKIDVVRRASYVRVWLYYMYSTSMYELTYSYSTVLYSLSVSTSPLHHSITPSTSCLDGVSMCLCHPLLRCQQTLIPDAVLLLASGARQQQKKHYLNKWRYVLVTSLYVSFFLYCMLLENVFFLSRSYLANADLACFYLASIYLAPIDYQLVFELQALYARTPLPS